MGLSPEYFFDLTPYQFTRLWERHRRKKREEWRPFAMLACLYANAHRRENHSGFNVDDFMPQDGAVLPKEQTTEQQIYMLKMWAYSQPAGVVQFVKGNNGS